MEIEHSHTIHVTNLSNHLSRYEEKNSVINNGIDY